MYSGGGDGLDREVATAFASPARLPISQVRAAGTSTTPHYTIIDMERSDDEESDHATDPLPQATRGRVSPSPYTANTERAKQFNSYVRGVIEQRLDVLIPISHQPRELVSQIIADASTRFPEFSSCVRKRIRTFLKSYRRSRKVRQDLHSTPNGMGMSPRSQEPSPVPTPPPTITMATGPSSHEPAQILEANEAALPSSPRTPPSPPHHQHIHIADIPDTKRIRLDTMTSAGSRPHPLSAPSSASLSGSEVTAVRQLISGYRESAGFLLRAADQLEAMLASKENSN